MREIKTKVVGVTFDNEDGSSRQDYISRLQVGDTLILEHDPDNRHDRDAVKVLGRWKQWFRWREGQIGHLSREVAEEVADYLQEGGWVYAEILDVTGGSWRKPTYGVNIAIYLE